MSLYSTDHLPEYLREILAMRGKERRFVDYTPIATLCFGHSDFDVYRLTSNSYTSLYRMKEESKKPSNMTKHLLKRMGVPTVKEFPAIKKVPTVRKFPPIKELPAIKRFPAIRKLPTISIIITDII